MTFHSGEPPMSERIRAAIYAAINEYGDGFSGAIDELDALEAERDKLRQALERIATIQPAYRRDALGFGWFHKDGGTLSPASLISIARGALSSSDSGEPVDQNG